MDEISLITKYFAPQKVWRGDVILPIGDDAAVVSVDGKHELVMCADLLVEGVHFPENTDPYAIGHKCLAVNLSDLAAMGAEPAWAVMTLSLPVAEADWLAAFSSGFFELAQRHRVQLIGGDMARGPLTIGVHVTGKLVPGTAMTRYHAAVGDDIYVSGSIGAAALGLQAAQGGGPFNEDERAHVISKLELPLPRVELGQRLRGIANSAIDLSDGLALDLRRVADASQVAAQVELELLPINKVYRKYYPHQWDLALGGGDDYELCFTAPASQRAQIQALSEELEIKLTRVGRIEEGNGIRFIDGSGELYESQALAGYDHFADL